MTNYPTAELRKANDIAAYKANAKAARAKLRREFRKLVKVHGYTWPEGWQDNDEFWPFVSATHWSDSAKAELKAIRELPLSYYE